MADERAVGETVIEECSSCGGTGEREVTYTRAPTQEEYIDCLPPGLRERAERAGEGLCAECGERSGTITWGDALAITHGGGEKWCERCAVSTQLEHARKRAAAIPELEARLAQITAEQRGADNPESSKAVDA